MPDWKNRIIDQGVQSADQFLANPLNWRTHPTNQRRAVRASLDTLGWIQQVIVNKRTGRLIDGHERVWQALDNNNADVPYLEVDLTEEEEAQALATLDPLSAMAGIDGDKLNDLMKQFTVSDPDLKSMLAKLAHTPSSTPATPSTVTAMFQILIWCDNEQQQAELLERFEEEGVKCRALIS